MCKFSLGIAIDCSNDATQPHADVAVFRKTGKVDVLDEHIHGTILKWCSRNPIIQIPMRLTWT